MEVNEKENGGKLEIPERESSETLSKKAIKKAKKWKKISAAMRMKRKEEKQRRKMRNKEKLEDETLSKKQRKNLERDKLRRVFESDGKTDLKICVDLQFENLMSNKELVHLASQLRRLYGVNKASENPAKITLAGLPEEGKTFNVFKEKNDGFANYIWHRSEKSIMELFPASNIVYLTPDSENVLKEIDTNKVYVIGGLVDDSVKKNSTLQFSKDNSLSTAKLPISDYCCREQFGTFKQILTINQVFEIILKFFESKSWTDAFSKSLPLKTGFQPIRNPDEEKNS